MNEINKLLKELTDNEPLRKELNKVDEKPFDDQPLFHGIPDPFSSPSPKRYKEKKINPFEYESTLLKTLEALNNIANTQNQLQVQYEAIWNQLHESKKELSVMVADEKYSNNELVQLKYEILDDALQSISNHIPEKQHRKPKEVQVELTQSQIVVLFHNMQKLGMVGKNIPNTLLAKSISEMTGLSKEKIRQALSAIKDNSDSVESVSFTENDYHRVKNKVQSLKEKIQQDLESKF